MMTERQYAEAVGLDMKRFHAIRLDGMLAGFQRLSVDGQRAFDVEARVWRGGWWEGVVALATAERLAALVPDTT